MAQRRSSRWRRRESKRSLLALTPRTLAVGSAALLAADWGTRLTGDGVLPAGPLDELAHLLTTLLVFWALGPRACERFLVPALVASVAIDADHVPDRLGFDWLTAGTPRPYTHSFATIVVALAIALLWRRRRDVMLGIALGLAIHFWRDTTDGDSGVSLLWPISYHSFQYRHSVYIAAMALFGLIAAARCAKQGSSGDRRERPRAFVAEQL